MMQLIATVQTLNGTIDRVVCEAESLETIALADSYWRMESRTLMTRIETDYVIPTGMAECQASVEDQPGPRP